MQMQPLIKQGWLRVLIFVIVLVTATVIMTRAGNAIVYGLNPGSNATADPGVTKQQLVLFSLLITFLASAGTVFLFRKFIDKHTLISLGLDFNGYHYHAATGFFLGLFLLGIGSFFLIASKNLQWTGISFDAKQLFLNLILMALVAFAEELVFRGYILNNLLQSMNKWTALIISSLLFTLFHLSNPDISLLALLNIFLSGLMLGINYIFTKNLWFAILLHFSWNFYEGPILGYKVSGLTLESLLQQELTGNPILTGGEFGFEGSMIAGLLSLSTVLILAWIYRKKFEVQGSGFGV
ncbi:MAG: CPBP family intramembrane glutamic endopeptidase [Chitinophagaceae bacterium]